MVDMFTLVLLFLLFFYDPTYQGDVGVALPSSTVVRAVEKGPKVLVTPEGVVVSGQTVLTVSAGDFGGSPARDGTAVVPLVDALGQLRSSSSTASTEEPVLLVECDKRVGWNVLRAVLESAARAGFPKYRFVVVGGD